MGRLEAPMEASVTELQKQLSADKEEVGLRVSHPRTPRFTVEDRCPELPKT